MSKYIIHIFTGGNEREKVVEKREGIGRIKWSGWTNVFK